MRQQGRQGGRRGTTLYLYSIHNRTCHHGRRIVPLDDVQWYSAGSRGVDIGQRPSRQGANKETMLSNGSSGTCQRSRRRFEAPAVIIKKMLRSCVQHPRRFSVGRQASLDYDKRQIRRKLGLVLEGGGRGVTLHRPPHLYPLGTAGRACGLLCDEGGTFGRHIKYFRLLRLDSQLARLSTVSGPLCTPWGCGSQDCWSVCVCGWSHKRKRWGGQRSDVRNGVGEWMHANCTVTLVE